MAKDNRIIVALECVKCKRRNYHTEKRTKGEGAPKRLKMKKYCRHCKMRTVHKESK